MIRYEVRVEIYPLYCLGDYPKQQYEVMRD